MHSAFSEFNLKSFAGKQAKCILQKESVNEAKKKLKKTSSFQSGV